MILIATDGSAPARAAEALGLELARARGTTAGFVCVWAPLRGSFGVPLPEKLDREFIDAERTWAAETLEAARLREVRPVEPEVVGEGDQRRIVLPDELP